MVDTGLARYYLEDGGDGGDGDGGGSIDAVAVVVAVSGSGSLMQCSWFEMH